jgi:hypothetical protein
MNFKTGFFTMFRFVGLFSNKFLFANVHFPFDMAINMDNEGHIL